MSRKKLALIPGDCLFPDHNVLHPDEDTLFFMAEDYGLCTHFRYHRQKLVLFLSAMRSHADDVIRPKYPLAYWKLNRENKDRNYEDKLLETCNEREIGHIITYTLEDHFFRDRIQRFCEKHDIALNEVHSSSFLYPIDDFKDFRKQYKPYMAKYYQLKREQNDILMEDDKPLHGKWSFDPENRKKLPKNIEIPDEPDSELTDHSRDVIKLVEDLFPDHPGQIGDFHWATTRRAALYRLEFFLKERFEDFGPYEDAIHSDYSFIFHSVLSPYLNMGLITPSEVLDKALSFAAEHEVHYPSVEGFVRQIMGWREFMRGMYHTEDMQKNYFNHGRKLTEAWYTGKTGIPPVDDTIHKVTKHGYAHHIERLMVMGNIMLLCEIHPDEVYRWFMEMFVDSADWVMVPNVYGMSQFADGGSFATKPYIGGSNYILKMSNYSKGEWCEIWNGLYWRFIAQNRDTFANNQRMSMMMGTLDRMNKEKRDRLFDLAEEFISKNTN